MPTRLSRWGNSLGLRIPSHIAQCASLKAGTPLIVRLLDSGDILVRPVNPEQHHGNAVSPPSAPKPLTDEEVLAKW